MRRTIATIAVFSIIATGCGSDSGGGEGGWSGELQTFEDPNGKYTFEWYEGTAWDPDVNRWQLDNMVYYSVTFNDWPMNYSTCEEAFNQGFGNNEVLNGPGQTQNGWLWVHIRIEGNEFEEFIISCKRCSGQHASATVEGKIGYENGLQLLDSTDLDCPRRYGND